MNLASFVFSISSPSLAEPGKKGSDELALLAVFSDKGLCGLSVADKRLPVPFCHGIDEMKRPRDVAQKFEVLKEKLLLRVNGIDANLKWSDFDLADQPDFHVRVWREMFKIPFGKTASYSEVAERAGSPMGMRACGQACGANPILILIPCHRVVAANGLGGFGGGLDLKKKLLALEGIDWRELNRSRKAALK
ncbi:MAG TPA: methylated-DNA--[protein]-cysteine S-methyltransferase [Planctomycetota bacterium]|nr:methylated-DNA--[protein]-cysteine S-methyltransferase [Planctomycetota bacterium]